MVTLKISLKRKQLTADNLADLLWGYKREKGKKSNYLRAGKRENILTITLIY